MYTKSTKLEYEKQRLKLIKKAKKYYKSFAKIKIANLGVTFKPNTDDLRESPESIGRKTIGTKK